VGTPLATPAIGLARQCNLVFMGLPRQLSSWRECSTPLLGGDCLVSQRTLTIQRAALELAGVYARHTQGWAYQDQQTSPSFYKTLDSRRLGLNCATRSRFISKTVCVLTIMNLAFDQIQRRNKLRSFPYMASVDVLTGARHISRGWRHPFCNRQFCGCLGVI